MSKRGVTGQKSMLQKEEENIVSSLEHLSFNTTELEALLQSFNLEATKIEIVRRIKAFKELIVEVETEIPASDSQDGPQIVKTQKITLPTSGQIIQATGNSLRLACELIEAFGKSTKTTMMSQNDGSMETSPRDHLTDSKVQKFWAVQ